MKKQWLLSAAIFAVGVSTPLSANAMAQKDATPDLDPTVSENLAPHTRQSDPDTDFEALQPDTGGVIDVHFIGDTVEEIKLKKQIAEIKAKVEDLKKELQTVRNYQIFAKRNAAYFEREMKKYRAMARVGEVDFSAFQFALRKLGYLDPAETIDGKYGRLTAKAIAEFQSRHTDGRNKFGWQQVDGTEDFNKIPASELEAAANRWLTSPMALDLICYAAVEKRDPYTLYYLAKMYFDGRGFVQNYDKAQFAARDAEIILIGESNNPQASARVRQENATFVARVKDFREKNKDKFALAQTLSYTDEQLCEPGDFKVQHDDYLEDPTRAQRPELNDLVFGNNKKDALEKAINRAAKDLRDIEKIIDPNASAKDAAEDAENDDE